MKTMEKTDYLKSVVEQYYPGSRKPTSKGWKLLEDDTKTFEQLMQEYKNTKKQSDKACVILKAVEKATTETEVKTLCSEISKEAKYAGKWINMIDTAYPDSNIARKVIEITHIESYANVLRKTSEITIAAKKIREIVKAMKL